MNLVFISVIVLSVLQWFVCGFSWALLLSYIGRLIFLSRLIGAVVPVKVSMGMEVAHLFFVFIGIIFSKGGNDWINIGLTVLFSALCCLLYFIDNAYYVYVVEDDDNEEE